MATVQKKMIRAAANYRRLLPEQLLTTGYTVVNSLRGNASFPNAPVDLGVLQSSLDAYADTIGVAKDGSRKAIALRDNQGEEIVRMLHALASYVEFNCKDDMHVFLTSGFQPRAGRATPQPLEQPVIDAIDQGMTGQLLVRITPVRNARTYELRFGPADSGGAVPAWSVQTVAKAKAAAAINGLTPGVVYAIQVRAFGPLGYTEWSGSSSRMCI